jgi:dihydroflavonol-4-reductase
MGQGRVLVTGATGYAAGHCISDLLAHGYHVRGTVRNIKTADIGHLRPLIERDRDEVHDTDSLTEQPGTLEFAEATLDSDEGWAEAAAECDYVLHVASPIPFKAPKHEDEIIRPALDGTRRVITAAVKAGVKRVVCTSSLDVVTRNSATAGRTRTEADWSDLADCNAYAKSKLLAEKAAWELSAEHGIEVAVLHPGAIIGPPLQLTKVSSGDMVRQMLAGRMPVVPPLHLAYTDVRDLATAHRLALEVPEAKGNRYIVAGEAMSMIDIARILRTEYGPHGYKISTRPFPAWAMRAVARINAQARLAADMLGVPHDVTADKARRELGWVPRPVRDSVLDTARILIAEGIVTAKKPAAATSTAA